MIKARTVLSISVHKCHKLRQLNVQFSFLFLVLDKPVYMKAPEGLEVDTLPTQYL